MILFPATAKWRFFDFVYPNEVNPIEEWYQRDLSDDAKFSFNDMLKECSKIEDHRHWLHYKGHMKGKKLKKYGIFELKFSCVEKLQKRVLVLFGPDRRQVTLLIGCHHKGDVYTPANTLDMAVKRAKLLNTGEAKTNERKIDIY